MSRRNGPSRVSGPNSALTEFLREKGIDASGIQEAARARARARDRAAQLRNTAATAASTETEEAADEDEEVGESSAAAGRRKRKSTKPKDEDEDMPDVEDEDEEEEEPKPARSRRARGMMSARKNIATTEIKLKITDPKKRKRKSITYTEPDSESEFKEDEEEEEVVIRTTRTRKPTKARLAKIKAAEKKKYEENDDSDFEDSFQVANAPVPGQIAFCAECNCRFIATVYSKAPKDGDGLLCSPCGTKQGPSEAAVKNKKKKQQTAAVRTAKKSNARALLDGDINGIKSLQEMCINVVAKHIDDVESLGDMGSHNMDRISEIICKNRRLRDDTIKLFFEPAYHVLRFYDCSKVSADSLRQIAAFVPTLRRLYLFWCGLINDECVDYYGTQLKELRSLELYGAFNVTEPCWVRLFKTVGRKLEEFGVSDTSRFKSASIESLVDNCPDLNVLRLCKLTHMNDQCVRLLTGLPHLKILEISDPQDSITDGAIIDLLNSCGSGLTELTLTGCSELTDETLQAIHASCGRLEILNIAHFELITNDGISDLFTGWSQNSGLKELTLTNCISLQSSGFARIIDHSGHSLEKLSISRCKDVDSSAWEFLQEFTLPNLEHFDVSFVRSVDDTVVEMLLKIAPELRFLKVWGDYKITQECHLRPGFQLVGRESDILA